MKMIMMKLLNKTNTQCHMENTTSKVLDYFSLG